MSDYRFSELFKRYHGHPIIAAWDVPYKANSVFNAGATKAGDETLLLMRVEDRRGISHLTVARSKDGVTKAITGLSPPLKTDKGWLIL